jgi:hypothetical protein
VTQRTVTGRAALRIGIGVLAATVGLVLGGQPAGAAAKAVFVVSADQPAAGIPPGQAGTSTVRVTNTATRGQGRAKVTVDLPAAVPGQPTVTFTPAAGVTCKAKKATPLAPVCALGPVDAGATVSVGTLTAVAPSDTGSGLSISTTVAGPTNTVTASFQWAASLPDLTTSVTLSPTVIELGQWITGTLTVTNTGFGAAGGFEADVPFPSQADPDTLVSETAGTSCIPYYGQLFCTMPGLAPGASATAVWSFQPQSGPSAQVTATADTVGTVIQGTRAGDVATSNSVPVDGTGAVLTVTSSNPATVPQGSNFTRTLTVTNSGDTPALGTVVSDYSAAFTYLYRVGPGTCAPFTVAVGGKGGSHAVPAGTECSIGTVPAGGSVSVTFVLEATPTQAVLTDTNKVVTTTTTPGGSSTPGTSSVTIVVPSSPIAPVLLTPPTAPQGPVVVGDTLSAASGTWNGTPVLAFTYQWQDCDSTGTDCVAIPSATGATYTVQVGDVGSTIEAVVTATNGGGSAAAASAPTAVAIAAQAPTVVYSPTISGGEPAVGVAYTAASGTWDGTPTITYAYQWFDCDSTGRVCTPIAGATGTTYVLTSADMGRYVDVQVTATNTGGSTTAPSNLVSTSD